MKKGRSKKKKKVDLGQDNKGEDSLFSPLNSVSLKAQQEYFLGFKRKNFNELWRWDTLEDVKFK